MRSARLLRGPRIAYRRARCEQCNGALTIVFASSDGLNFVFASPATVDLITFLGVNANGAKMDSPSIKR